MSTRLLQYMDRMADPSGRVRFILRPDDNGHLRMMTLANLADDAEKHAAKKQPLLRKWFGNISDRCPPRSRQALRLYLREGSASAVAEIMRISESTVRYYIAKAIMRCRLSVMRGSYPPVLRNYVRRQPGLTKHQSLMAACVATCNEAELHKLKGVAYTRRGHLEKNINALAKAMKRQEE